jgi:hypothetical protein
MHPVCVRSSQSSELADRDRMQRLAVPLTTLRNAVDFMTIWTGNPHGWQDSTVTMQCRSGCYGRT